MNYRLKHVGGPGRDLKREYAGRGNFSLYFDKNRYLVINFADTHISFPPYITPEGSYPIIKQIIQDDNMAIMQMRDSYPVIRFAAELKLKGAVMELVEM